jgi:hypothetical protein
VPHGDDGEPDSRGASCCDADGSDSHDDGTTRVWYDADAESGL